VVHTVDFGGNRMPQRRGINHLDAGAEFNKKVDGRHTNAASTPGDDGGFSRQSEPIACRVHCGLHNYFVEANVLKGAQLVA
jgi:hypothetical protein